MQSSVASSPPGHLQSRSIWRRRESNPGPEVLHQDVYRNSRYIKSRPVAPSGRLLRPLSGLKLRLRPDRHGLALVCSMTPFSTVTDGRMERTMASYAAMAYEVSFAFKSSLPDLRGDRDPLPAALASFTPVETTSPPKGHNLQDIASRGQVNPQRSPHREEEVGRSRGVPCPAFRYSLGVAGQGRKDLRCI